MGKARTQKVDIYFNYVGLIDIAYTEEELAEMKAQEEQAEATMLASPLLIPQFTNRFASNAVRNLSERATINSFAHRSARKRFVYLRLTIKDEPKKEITFIKSVFAKSAEKHTGQTAVCKPCVLMNAEENITTK